MKEFTFQADGYGDYGLQVSEEGRREADTSKDMFCGSVVGDVLAIADETGRLPDFLTAKFYKQDGPDRLAITHQGTVEEYDAYREGLVRRLLSSQP